MVIMRSLGAYSIKERFKCLHTLFSQRFTGVTSFAPNMMKVKYFFTGITPHLLPGTKKTPMFIFLQTQSSRRTLKFQEPLKPPFISPCTGLPNCKFNNSNNNNKTKTTHKSLPMSYECLTLALKDFSNSERQEKFYTSH